MKEIGTSIIAIASGIIFCVVPLSQIIVDGVVERYCNSNISKIFITETRLKKFIIFQLIILSTFIVLNICSIFVSDVIFNAFFIIMVVLSMLITVCWLKHIFWEMMIYFCGSARISEEFLKRILHERKIICNFLYVSNKYAYIDVLISIIIREIKNNNYKDIKNSCENLKDFLKGKIENADPVDNEMESCIFKYESLMMCAYNREQYFMELRKNVTELYDACRSCRQDICLKLLNVLYKDFIFISGKDSDTFALSVFRIYLEGYINSDTNADEENIGRIKEKTREKIIESVEYLVKFNKYSIFKLVICELCRNNNPGERYKIIMEIGAMCIKYNKYNNIKMLLEMKNETDNYNGVTVSVNYASPRSIQDFIENLVRYNVDFLKHENVHNIYINISCYYKYIIISLMNILDKNIGNHQQIRRQLVDERNDDVRKLIIRVAKEINQKFLRTILGKRLIKRIDKRFIKSYFRNIILLLGQNE